jgi:hypothetical protein
MAVAVAAPVAQVVGPPARADLEMVVRAVPAEAVALEAPAVAVADLEMVVAAVQAVAAVLEAPVAVVAVVADLEMAGAAAVAREAPAVAAAVRASSAWSRRCRRIAK